MNSCCLKRLYKSHVIELMLEKSEQSQNWGWPHYIVDYLVGKEMRDYTWSEDDESTTYYLSNYLSRARQKISVLLKLSTISR